MTGNVICDVIKLIKCMMHDISPLLSLNSILIFFVFGKYRGSKKSSCKCVAKIPDTFLSSRFSKSELASAAPSRADVPLPVNQ